MKFFYLLLLFLTSADLLSAVRYETLHEGTPGERIITLNDSFRSDSSELVNLTKWATSNYHNAVTIFEIWPKLATKNDRLGSVATILNNLNGEQLQFAYALLNVDTRKEFQNNSLRGVELERDFQFTPLLNSVEKTSVPADVLLYMFSRSPIEAMKTLVSGELPKEVQNIETLRRNLEELRKEPDNRFTLGPASDLLKESLQDSVKQNGDLFKLYVAGVLVSRHKDPELRRSNNPSTFEHLNSINDPVLDALLNFEKGVKIQTINEETTLQLPDIKQQIASEKVTASNLESQPGFQAVKKQRAIPNGASPQATSPTLAVRSVVAVITALVVIFALALFAWRQSSKSK